MISRRRFISIAAGVGATTAWFDALADPQPRVPIRRWRGVALGAAASITLVHEDAPRLIAQARAEIERLENLFSLFRADSALSRLNRTRRLDNPPPDLTTLLSLCDGLHVRTDGAFDPAIQPLWVLYARCHGAGRSPSLQEIDVARTKTGWRNVTVSESAITLDEPGAGLSLNGIAQGYIADKVTERLHAEGVHNALINMGELRALGYGPDGRPWRIGVSDPDRSGRARDRIAVTDMALAVSEPLGTTFDPQRMVGHVFDPRTGRPGGRWHQVSVVAPSAALADGLSTAFCIMPSDAIATAAQGLQVHLVAPKMA